MTMLQHAIPLLAALAPQLEDEAPKLPPHAFENRFWINLHHFLFHEALPPKPGEPAREEIDEPGWLDALAYYADQVVERDLLFDPEMRAIDLALGELDEEDELETTGIDGTLAAILRGAAPLYRERFWPEHEKANDAWIARAKPLFDEHGPAIAAELTRALQSSWPEAEIRFDVLVYANWAGAYTSIGPPHVRVASLYPSTDSDAEALEVLIHEASHLLYGPFGGPLNGLIARAATKHGIEVPRDLWHAILFMTAGELVRRSPAAPEDYVPYAEKHGLWKRGPWPRYHDALKTSWPAYLDGDATVEDTIDRVVGALRPPK